ncbi:glycosyltransferase family 4 protein [Enterovirga rhinocerotis]|uniref:Glycosyltransferase involved in cell wall biosynthesis n=1 Tax=Enterovirga rhinocerotis TaxID=1339210 RepID=A0A4R7CBJ7_9HYPH|nr:glycosyltransferase family 4 protein [Enterovirga rhinocerotis]TDR94815.1 glycosyltransferase involved in cell wall biosynthesis [Enterovirga rhinocerotis]
MTASSGPLRILHVFRAPLGGLFRHVLDVAHGQIERGHEVGIFCDASTGGARAEAALAELAPALALGMHRVPMRRLPHPSDLSALSALGALYRRARPHVLHAHGSKGGVYARVLTIPGLGRHTIRAYTPHGGSFNYHPGSGSHRLYMAIERLLERRTDAFLFESDYIRDRFETFVGRSSKLVRVIRNGIAEEEFTPLERASDPFDLVYLGELREAKGVDTLIDALAIIRQRQGRAPTLLAVGSGPSEEALRRRAAEAGVVDAITFEPPQPIRPALARACIMVIPSKAESLPYVILEAAAAAQPLVSTDVGGIPEIFGPYGAELIRPDDPAVLATAIAAKMAEPEETRMEKARALSDQVRQGFRIDTMVERGIEGYREALAARGI